MHFRCHDGIGNMRQDCDLSFHSALTCTACGSRDWPITARMTGIGQDHAAGCLPEIALQMPASVGKMGRLFRNGPSAASGTLLAKKEKRSMAWAAEIDVTCRQSSSFVTRLALQQSEQHASHARRPLQVWNRPARRTTVPQMLSAG